MTSTVKETLSSTSSTNSHRNLELNDHIDEDATLAIELSKQEANLEPDCASDTALAIILQKQFDLEYNSQLKKEEARLNGHSKVGVSLDRFKRSSCSNSGTSLQDDFADLFYEEGESLDEGVNPKHVWDVFEQGEIKRRSRMMGRSGFVLDEDGNMITKHDIPTSSRKNMCRLMELKTDIQTGDAGGTRDDFKITNYVYNKLKVHSKKNSRKATQRLFDKKERENEAILFDIQSCKMSDATRAIMDGLLVRYKIEQFNGVIGHGKESTVLHATGCDCNGTPGQEVAIKIFNSHSNVAFKTRDLYNKSKCPSYKFDKPRSKNDLINKWAERGFKNLKLLRKADINCPDAISLKKNVLLMTFLGSNAKPSPQLKYVHLDDNQLKESYTQVIDIMRRMYDECDLIHADLSEYNLLWHDEQVYVIDVSQSMFTSHPNANSFLYRDCKNILDFYRKSGMLDLLDEKSLFTLITGKDLKDKDIELWSKIEDFPSNDKLQQRDENADKKHRRPDCFTQLFDASKHDTASLKDGD